MKGILFRGKDENNEWHEGFIVEATNCITDKKSIFIIESDANYYSHGEFDLVYEVIPETVEQITVKKI